MQEISELNKKKLRDFGLLIGVIVAVLFGILLPWIRGHSLLLFPWTTAVILWLLAVLTPTTLKPIYQVWMQIGLILGWINTRIILGFIFFGLITPMGVIMRLLNRDPMTRKFKVNFQTYRVPSQKVTRKSMEKPY